MTPLQLMTEGGPLMFPIVLGAGIHVALQGMQLITLTVLDLRTLLRAGLAALVLTGLFGTVLGLIMTFDAVAMASPETKFVLMSQGISISLYTTLLSLVLVVPLSVGVGVLSSLKSNLDKRTP